MGFEAYSPMAYDEILRTGNRIFCIAADDNHNGEGDRKYHDSFGGFIVIRAEKLDYRTITRALENGDFYASMGPEIHDLYIENNEVHITCSPAKFITLHCGVRRSKRVAARDGEYLTHASFPIDFESNIYFRLGVHDENGNHANTNAYFCDTLLS